MRGATRGRKPAVVGDAELEPAVGLLKVTVVSEALAYFATFCNASRMQK